jgi:hypothetical protein
VICLNLEILFPLLVAVFEAKDGKSFILWGEQRFIPYSTIMDAVIPPFLVGPKLGVRGCCAWQELIPPPDKLLSMFLSGAAITPSAGATRSMFHVTIA